MFTGIIQGVGIVRRSQLTGLDLRLGIDPGALGAQEIGVGDSVAVDGVCLTVSAITDGRLEFFVSRESLSRTLLGGKVVGDRVNLELALLPSTRLGGHFVTGHVDGIGRLETRHRIGLSDRLCFSVPADLSRFVAEKGTICIDGVSLTVNAVSDDNLFEVNIVPHTARTTTMDGYEPGARVHIEVDLIARYLDRLMNAGLQAGTKGEPRTGEKEDADDSGEITQDFLAGRGFTAPDIGESDR